LVVRRGNVLRSVIAMSGPGTSYAFPALSGNDVAVHQPVRPDGWTGAVFDRPGAHHAHADVLVADQRRHAGLARTQANQPDMAAIGSRISRLFHRQADHGRSMGRIYPAGRKQHARGTAGERGDPPPLSSDHARNALSRAGPRRLGGRPGSVRAVRHGHCPGAAFLAGQRILDQLQYDIPRTLPRHGHRRQHVPGGGDERLAPRGGAGAARRRAPGHGC
jgi:hypothetical protein